MNAQPELISAEELINEMLTANLQIIDVRAPIEYLNGKIPGSINLPILNDEERRQVGTAYKQQGSAQAIQLGHQLIQGEIKNNRVQAWSRAILNSQRKTYLTCFRGGLRSKITQQWLFENGLVVTRLEGGYKKMRQLLMQKTEEFCQSNKLIVLTGQTGSGKTKLLQNYKKAKIDLENLAHHRGSAFGGYKNLQPSQVDFENNLAIELIKLAHIKSLILIEDESRLIGRVVQPPCLFSLLRNSPVIQLEEELGQRVENTLHEYVISRLQDPELFDDLEKSLSKIKNKLGLLRYHEVLMDLKEAKNKYAEHLDSSASRIWIEKLLVWYYDPIYTSSLNKRSPQFLFKGNLLSVTDFLDSQI